MFAFRVWIVAFLFLSQMHNAVSVDIMSATVWATLFAFAGVAANMVFGELAIAFNRRGVLIGVSLISILATIGYADGIIGPLAAGIALDAAGGMDRAEG